MSLAPTKECFRNQFQSREETLFLEVYDYHRHNSQDTFFEVI